jgi:hypothetical protein
MVILAGILKLPLTGSKWFGCGRITCTEEFWQETEMISNAATTIRLVLIFLYFPLNYGK